MVAEKPRKKKVQSEINDWLETYKAQVEARYNLTMAGYKIQDDKTKEVINRICDRLIMSATGLIRIPGGTVIKIEQTYVDQNALFIALEIMKDMALMDIKVANFKFPPSYCAECGVKLGATKKRRQA